MNSADTASEAIVLEADESRMRASYARDRPYMSLCDSGNGPELLSVFCDSENLNIEGVQI
jgi:hypothetical protein